MNDSSSSLNNTDNSLISKETEANSSNNISFEKQNISSEAFENRIISAITANLKEIIEENIKNGGEKYIMHDIFYLEEIPTISLENYIKRLVKYTKINISTLILSIIYIDKFCEKCKYYLSFNNVYRLLLASTLMSIKFNEDVTVNTKTYSKIAGVTINDLNILEYQICIALDFAFHIEADYYQQYYSYFSKY